MRPSRDKVLVEVAHSIAKRGTCSRKKVGVVVAREGRILATGYNGAASGLPHCEHSCTCGAVHHLAVPDHSPDCQGLQPCRTAVHAEANAIAFAAKHGISLEGGDLYSTYGPCLPCAQLIVNAGINRVLFSEDYWDEDGVKLLYSARIKVFSIGEAQAWEVHT